MFLVSLGAFPGISGVFGRATNTNKSRESAALCVPMFAAAPYYLEKREGGPRRSCGWVFCTGCSAAGVRGKSANSDES
jgi:hypothetical protein